MKSRKFFTLLALMVGFMTLASCKGQAKNNEAASDTETTGKETAAPVHLNKADFLKKVYNYEASPNEWKYLGNRPAIIDFYADWCGPCKMIAPSLEQLAKEYAGQINIYIKKQSWPRHSAFREYRPFYTSLWKESPRCFREQCLKTS